MSLVNDALRRAREVQREAPPSLPPGPQLLPAVSSVERPRRLGFLLGAGLGAVTLAILLLMWRLSVYDSGVRARQAPTETAPAPGTVATVEPAAPAAAPAPAPAAPAPVAPSGTAPVVPAPAQAVVSPPEAVPVTSPAPAPVPADSPALRLQAIVLDRTRPSALISGKTLFLGDRLGDLRLVALDHQTATLIGGGATNILSLP